MVYMHYQLLCIYKHKMKFFISILFMLSKVINTKGKCGYQTCPQVEEYKINVHLICHSHNDVGWLKTPKEYFDEDVSRILASVFTSLEKNPSRKFIQVETYYLFKYLTTYPNEFERVKRLIESGQFEIAGGGWSMNDEAVTHYQSIIDQMTYALRKLNDTFGDCARPRVGWQIDSFGHSREMASIFALMGFDGLFFSRIHYQDKEIRTEQLKLEEIWLGNDDLGKASEIFFSIFRHHYTPFPNILYLEYPYNITNNINKYLEKVFDAVIDTISSYRSRNLIITMGGDFTYRNAENWFSNIDTLIDYSKKIQLNNDYEFNIFYSTPSCYIKSLNDANLPWTEYTKDFFPYATDENTYWTGFYTSRPAFKYFERRSNNLLQVAHQLQVLSNQSNDYIDKLQSQMGVVQHHDSITGTSKNNVNRDYRFELNDAFEHVETATHKNLNEILGENLPFEKCNFLNLSQCSITENTNEFSIIVYNPLAQFLSHYIRLPIQNYSYEVIDHQGNSLDCDIIPIPQRIINLFGRKSSATHEIVFLAENLPPLGFTSYLLKRNNTKNDKKNENDLTLIKGESISINFDYRKLIYSISFDNVSIPLSQEFFTYAPDDSISLGLYVARSKPSIPVIDGHFPLTKVILGSLVEEVHQQFNNYISQITRIYKKENHVEVDWVIGPLPNDTVYEITTQFKTSLRSNGIFSTDSNGRQTVARKINQQKFSFLSATSQLYYPVTTKITIEDENKRFSVLTDRSQGGTSLNDGNLELLIYRYVTGNSEFGLYDTLDEGNYENLQIRGQHYLIGGASSDKFLRFQERQLALKKLLRPWYFLSPASSSVWNRLKNKSRLTYSGLIKPLPPNVHFLTLEKVDNSTLLLRFEHLIGSKDDPVLSQPATIDVSTMFSDVKIKAIRETTLAANQWISESKRLQWYKWFESENIEKDKDKTFFKWNDSNFEVKLQPMEIRTFIAKI